MADPDPQLALETPSAPEPAPAPPPEPTPPPDLAAELEAERARRADLEARLARVEAERPAPAPPPAPPQEPQREITPELVEQAFSRGEITEAQRQQWHAKLALQSATAEQSAQVAVQGATDRLLDYVRQYPDLRVPSSELFGVVNPEIHRLAREFGLDPRDVRVQALAVERVLAQRGVAMTARESDRTLRPVAGSPGARAGSPAPLPPKDDPLRGVPTSMVRQWQDWGFSEADVAEAAARHRARMERRRERFGAA